MQFDFGKNWDDFSKNALTHERVDNAKKEFFALIEGIYVNGKTFLDIGFGQGLSLLIAGTAGANCYGCDINPKCKMVLDFNRSKFFNKEINEIPVVIGSITEAETLNEIIKMNPEGKQFDIVHSWGVLHHTGQMEKAIINAASLVKPSGYLIIAIYNKHWTSKAWLLIKYLYNLSPVFIKWFMIKFFYGIIASAKLIVTGKNPFRQERGMNFYFDVIDWVGGYPYEYASSDEIIKTTESLGFRCIKLLKSKVPTGCNEFIFKKSKENEMKQLL